MTAVSASIGGFAVDATAGGITWSRTLGVEPNVNSVPIAWTEEAIPTTPVDVVISDGTTSVTIPDCKIDSHVNKRNAGGSYIELVVRDRRWAWARGWIIGEYNAPGADGRPVRSHSARDLADLLLTAMGETTYDVSALPADVYPHVLWEWANPAAELQRLAETYGCAVALLLDDSVEIVKLGVGADFPSGAFESDAPGETTTGRPGAYRVAGGRSILQRTFRLEAVGLDTDGRVKRLPELSYAPDGSDPHGGFGVAAGYEPPLFVGLGYDGSVTTWSGSGAPPWFSPAQDAARKSIYRLYRIPRASSYLLPLLSEIVETETDGSGDEAVTRRKKPYLTNQSVSLIPDWETGRRVAEGRIEPSEFELDSRTGTVKLTEPRFVYDGSYTPAVLDLTAAYRSRGAAGLTSADYYWYLVGSGGETVIAAPALVAEGIVDGSGAAAWQNVDGSGGLDELAAAIIAAADPGADYVVSREATLSGIVSNDLDGKMRSITYHVGSDGASTTLQWNLERPRAGAPTSAEKGRRAALAIAARESQATAVAARDSVPAVHPRAAGVTVAPPAEDGGEWRWLVNASRYTCPKGGVVFIGGVGPDGRAAFGRPNATGQISIGLAAEEIPPGYAGRVYDRGAHYCTVENISSGAGLVGRFLNTRRNSFRAQLCGAGASINPASYTWGPLRIRRVLSTGASAAVIAEIVPLLNDLQFFIYSGTLDVGLLPLARLHVGAGFTVWHTPNTDSVQIRWA